MEQRVYKGSGFIEEFIWIDVEYLNILMFYKEMQFRLKKEKKIG